MTDFDRAMLEDLNERLSRRHSDASQPAHRRIVPVLQPVFTKVDSFRSGEEELGRFLQEVRHLAPLAADPILSAITPKLGGGPGIASARLAIAQACAQWQ